MELSLPARDLATGIVAFENGADSIYFGLERFSARASAANFSVDDYRKIRKYALSHNKKIYIALNTIVRDDELSLVYKYLSIISLVGCDGLLVQDWGVVRIVQKFFPGITLHASTQMAIQNSDGVFVLKKLGFERVVLARELSMENIRQIRLENPDIELKVFVHGALCYCISGLCYMSRKLLDKGSANRGECIQACRFAYDGLNRQKEHPFSLKDLISDGKIINELAEIGVDSVKVEGRLKSSVYVKWASRYYRALLNKDSQKWINECRFRMQSAFSRDSSQGYFYSACEDDLHLNDYQGHRGCICGKFSAGKIFLNQEIRKHDGLAFFDKNGFFHKFANMKGNFKGIVNQNVLIEKTYCIQDNAYLYKIKDSRDNAGESFNPDSLEMQRISLGINLQIESGKLILSTFLPFGRKIEKNYFIEIQRARSEQNTEQNIKKVFNRKYEWVELGDIIISNHTDLSLKQMFIPTSILKETAHDFLTKCEEGVLDYINRDYANEEEMPVLRQQADCIVSPIAFDRGAVDCSADKITEINNLCDLKTLLEQNTLQKVKGIVIGPYFNVANREAVLYFQELLKDKFVGCVSFVEGDISDKLLEHLIDGEKVFEERKIPYFIKKLPEKYKFLRVCVNKMRK